MKKAVNDVVGGFVSGLKTGVTGSSAMKFEVDLSTKTNKKIDEIVANVNFLQEKTVKDTEKIIKGFSKDLKDVVVELIDRQMNHLRRSATR